MKKDAYKLALAEEFDRTVNLFLIYVGTGAVWTAAIFDFATVGFDGGRVFNRLIYLPFVVTVVWIWRHTSLKTKFPELPVWLVAIWAIWFCTHYSMTTGNIRSAFISGFVQLMFLIAVMPVSSKSFYGILIYTHVYYALANYVFGSGNVSEDLGPITNMTSLLLFSTMFHVVVSKLRYDKLRLDEKLSEQMKNQQNIIAEQSQQIAKSESQIIFGKMARRVAHDIRSPVAALRIVLEKSPSLEGNVQRLAFSALDRINDIANDILQQGNNATLMGAKSETARESLLPLIETVIAEKKIQYENRREIAITCHVCPEATSLLAEINAKEFRRSLSNLVQNAIEAIPEKGAVSVEVKIENQSIIIAVVDDGVGIPEDFLKQLKQEGATFGKKNGSGIGLAHAALVAKQWHGDLAITSQLGRGTRVQLTLPQST